MEDNINIYNFNSIDFENNYLSNIEFDCYPGQRRPKFKSNERMKVNTSDIYSEKDLFSKYSNNDQNILIIKKIKNNKDLSLRRSSNYKIQVNLNKKVKNSKVSINTNNIKFKNENNINKRQINAVKYINSIINSKKTFQIKELMIKKINNNLCNNKSYSKSTYEFSTSFRDNNKSNLYKINEQKIKICPNQKSKLLIKKSNKTSSRKISINTENSNNSNKEYIISNYISSNKIDYCSKIICKNNDNSKIDKNKNVKKHYKFICVKNLKKERNNKYINRTEYPDIKTKTFFSNKNLKKNKKNKSPKKNININSFNENRDESNVNPKEKNIKEYSSKKGPLSIEIKCKEYKKLKSKMKCFNKKNRVRAMLISKEELIKN